jgi:hypothetical protein
MGKAALGRRSTLDMLPRRTLRSAAARASTTWPSAEWRHEHAGRHNAPLCPCLQVYSMITAIELGSKERMVAFCKGIQRRWLAGGGGHCRRCAGARAHIRRAICRCRWRASAAPQHRLPCQHLQPASQPASQPATTHTITPARCSWRRRLAEQHALTHRPAPLSPHTRPLPCKAAPDPLPPHQPLTSLPPPPPRPPRQVPHRVVH